MILYYFLETHCARIDLPCCPRMLVLPTRRSRGFKHLERKRKRTNEEFQEPDETAITIYRCGLLSLRSSVTENLENGQGANCAMVDALVLITLLATSL